MLRPKLQEFISLLDELGVPLASWLAPGLEEDEVRQAAERDGLPLRQETIDWYGVIGGIDETKRPADVVGMFSPDFQPISLNLALELRSQIVAMHSVNSATADPVGHLDGVESFMPIGVCGMVRYGAVQRDGSTTPVHTYDPVEASQTFEHETWSSIEWMVTDWIVAWQDGIFVCEPNGAVVLDM